MTDDTSLPHRTEAALDRERLSAPPRLINRAWRLLTRIGDARLRAIGFAVGQLPVVVSLKNNAALSQKELAQIAQIEQPSMAQMLARMERDGLIRRVPDSRDGRSSLVMLTDVAEDRLPQARTLLLQGHREALAGFSDDEIEQLTQFLERMIANLEAARTHLVGEVSAATATVPEGKAE